MRTGPHPRLAVFAFSCSLLLLTCASAWAAWPSNVNDAVAVCTASGTQDAQVVVSDGAGGVIIAWEDQRSGIFDIYALRLLANGDIAPGWSANGTVICSQAAVQTNPTICSDGAGGAIIAWEDARSNTGDVYAQRISYAGAVMWTANGVQLVGVAGLQRAPRAIVDGVGGAIVVWEDHRAGAANADIYGQRINGASILQPGWGGLSAVGLVTVAGAQIDPRLIPDETGGLLVAFTDIPNGTVGYAKRFTSTGTTVAGWPAGGVNIAGFSWGFVADDLGGLIAASGNGDYVGFLRITPSGALDWSYSQLSSFGAGAGIAGAIRDGSGGMCVVWNDGNSGMRSARLGRGGAMVPGWPFSPLGTQIMQLAQNEHALVSDGSRGMIYVGSAMMTAPNTEIWAQHVRNDAQIVVEWPVPATGQYGGTPISLAPQDQTRPQAVSDGGGGAIVAWTDQRAGVGIYDIYAQRIDYFGKVGNPEPKIAQVRDVPNDQGGQVRIRWSASYVDSVLRGVDTYSVWRQVPPAAAMAAIEKGALRTGDELGAHRSPEAIAARQAGRRVFQAVATGTQVVFWEFMASLLAHGTGTYSYVAATTSDSTAGYNPLTIFRVDAEHEVLETVYNGPTRQGTSYWRSAPDSGYSVDNLPPDPPAPFAGNYNSGTSTLHWRPNAEPDVRGYRLYRGSPASFVPGPLNFVSELPDTNYVDPAGAPYYYKLSAVDIHDNESDYTTLLPSGATGLPGPDGAALAFLGATPNPVQLGARFRFSLPRASRVSLAILDVSGRKVCTVWDGERGPGDQFVEWDGRGSNGRPLGSGVYIVRMNAAGRLLTQRMLVTR